MLGPQWVSFSVDIVLVHTCVSRAGSYQKATNGEIVLNPQRIKVENNVSDEYGLPIKHISLTKFCTEHSHTTIVLDVKF